MLGRALLWASSKPKVESFVKKSTMAHRLVDRFVAGDELDDAIAAIRQLNSHGIGGILDLLGEGVIDPAGAQAAADDYLTAIKRIEETKIDTTVTVKPTQLGLSFDKGACIDHLRRLAAEAQAIGVVVEIDIEQSAYVTDTLEVFRVLHADFPDLRQAIQVYLRRTPVDLEAMIDLAPKVRLVKGAYAEDPAVALHKRKEIDEQYRFLTEWLFLHGTDPAVATHDHRLIQHAKQIAGYSDEGKKSFEIQMLYGVRRELQQELADAGYRVRVYVPYGDFWYPYLTRRIAERPANLRVVMRAIVARIKTGPRNASPRRPRALPHTREHYDLHFWGLRSRDA